MFCCNILPRLLCVPPWPWLHTTAPFVEVLVTHSVDVKYVSSGLLFVFLIDISAAFIQVCLCIQQHIAIATLCS